MKLVQLRKELEEKMKAAAELEFETAAKYRDLAGKYYKNCPAACDYRQISLNDRDVIASTEGDA